LTRLAHISDPHFGTEDAPVCAALRDSLLAAAPDLVVLSGDVTQRARVAQFRAARAFVDSLAPLPVLALPGNHDLPLFDLLRRFTDPYGHYRRHFCATPEPVWQGTEALVVGVDSTRVLRHKHGELPPPLVARVARQLAAAGRRFRVVVLHHPLAGVEDSDRRNRVRGAEAALAAWTAAGADLFLGGHIHLPYCVAVGAATQRAVLLQAGTAVSTRRRGGRPNSYHLIHLEAAATRRMEIEQRDYAADQGRFVAGAGWQAILSAAAGWTLRGR
jgi:3',5'-cyclic AMP phosphodiesterase CpdA